MKNNVLEKDKSELVIYESKDGSIKLDVNLEDETVWLTQEQMSKLFSRDKSVISKHIKDAVKENEVDEISSVAKFATELSRYDPRTGKDRLCT